ncbi:MAG: 30S ribosomal protein S16 [Chitinophagales bacterium]|nr:MAG: 30S ribosomal protein S16 [Chitinophagales bacterium]
MAVRIRLQRHGKKKAPWFTIVVADSRSPRDGRFIERLGTYDPTTIPASITLNSERALEWLNKGAQPTHTARAILSYKGVLYRKHLLRGVAKGVLTQEQADAKYQEFLERHNEQVRRKREEQLNKEKRTRAVLIEAETKKKEAMLAARKPVSEPEAPQAAETTEAPAAQESSVQQTSPESTPQEEKPAADNTQSEAPRSSGEAQSPGA